MASSACHREIDLRRHNREVLGRCQHDNGLRLCREQLRVTVAGPDGQSSPLAGNPPLRHRLSVIGVYAGLMGTASKVALKAMGTPLILAWNE